MQKVPIHLYSIRIKYMYIRAFRKQTKKANCRSNFKNKVWLEQYLFIDIQYNSHSVIGSGEGKQFSLQLQPASLPAHINQGNRLITGLLSPIQRHSPTMCNAYAHIMCA